MFVFWFFVFIALCFLVIPIVRYKFFNENRKAYTSCGCDKRSRDYGYVYVYNPNCENCTVGIAPRRPYNSDSLIGVGIFLAVAVVPAFFVTATQISRSNNVENSFYFIQEKTAQRDAILNEFDEILDNGQFVELMNASVPDDLIALRNNPQVTPFLLGRADRIVAINAQLFEERDVILKQSRGICNTIQNPLIPQLPFITPDCKLGDIISLTSLSKENK